MHIFVLMLGFVAVAAGLAAFGFGYVIKEFSLGSTLLIAGTTAFVGGLVIIAVGGAIRELRRIAEALASRPAPRFPRPGEQFDPYAPGTFRPGTNVPRMPPAPMPPPAYGNPEGIGRSDQRPRETKLEAAALADPLPELTEPASPSLQPLAQTVAESPAGGPPVAEAQTTMFEEPDAVPLSPDETPRSPIFDRPDERQEPASEPDTEPQPAAQHDAHASDAPVQHDAAADKTDLVPSEEPAEPKRSPFDAIWPPRTRAPAQRHAETEDDVETAGLESIPAAAVPLAEPDASRQSDETVAGPNSADAVMGDAEANAPHAVSILKSGVVDGMAYTLYSNGSIEAELPTGTIRFESINELRMHLEKAG